MNFKDMTAAMTAALYFGGIISQVPFENLDQHPHDAGSSSTRWPLVPPHNVVGHARVGVERSVEKLVDYRRGGFCFEGNLAFCWLLRQFFPRVRLSLAQSYNPANPQRWNTPSHVVLLVRPGVQPPPPTQPFPLPPTLPPPPPPPPPLFSHCLAGGCAGSWVGVAPAVGDPWHHGQ